MPRAAVLVLFSLALFVPVAQSQRDESVADAARKQRALRQDQQTSKAKKVYRNSEVASPDTVQKEGGEKPAPAPRKNGPTAKSNESSGATPNQGTESSSTPIFDRPKDNVKENESTSTSVFDRPKDESADENFIIVPKFTEIRVEPINERGSGLAIQEAKVIVPVRIGFATAIPALSKVHLRFSYYSECGPLYEIVSIEINNRVYETETDSSPYWPSEMRFSLSKPLRIAR